MNSLNYLPKQYKKSNKLKINHSYLVEQFSDYSEIFKKIEKVVKKGDYTLGNEVNKFEKESLDKIREDHPEVLESINKEKELSEENNNKLKTFFDNFLKEFNK